MFAEAAAFATKVGRDWLIGILHSHGGGGAMYKPDHGPVKAGPLTLGFTVYGGRHHFGPELQFGHVLGDYFDNFRTATAAVTSWRVSSGITAGTTAANREPPCRNTSRT